MPAGHVRTDGFPADQRPRRGRRAGRRHSERKAAFDDLLDDDAEEVEGRPVRPAPTWRKSHRRTRAPRNRSRSCSISGSSSAACPRCSTALDHQPGRPGLGLPPDRRGTGQPAHACCASWGSSSTCGAGPIDTDLFPHWTSSTGDEVLVHRSPGAPVRRSRRRSCVPFHKPPVFARTKAIVHKGVFRPAPKSSTHTDHALRMLKLGDTSAVPGRPGRPRQRRDQDDPVRQQRHPQPRRSGQAHPDDAGPLSPCRRCAPAASRSPAPAAPCRWPPPCSGRPRSCRHGYFGNAGTPTLYEDDLTRGYRFDVLDDEATACGAR